MEIEKNCSSCKIENICKNNLKNYSGEKNCKSYQPKQPTIQLSEEQARKMISTIQIWANKVDENWTLTYWKENGYIKEVNIL